MKNTFKIIIGLLLVLTAAGCEQKYEAPNEYSDVAWYTSKQNGVDYKLKAGESISFMDLSQNFLSHTWEIEEGNSYLVTGFSNSDELTNFIDPEAGSVSEDLTVHILFQNKGINTVRLYNTFSEKVTYRGEFDFDAVQEGDLWVIDTTFEVDVYGPILPAFKVIKLIDDSLGNIISEEEILSISEMDTIYLRDSASWPTVELEAGSRLKLLDLTTEDRPNARVWTINNQDPASSYSDSASIVYFNQLGYIDMVGSLKSQRVQPAGDDMPAASAIKNIPLKVNVIKSTKPFIALDNFNEIEGKEAISFIVSGEVSTITDAVTAFTINVSNPSTGFNEAIAATAVKVNTSDASIVELTLADTIYGNDVITVSFDNTIGTIVSVDGRELSSFTSKSVEMAVKGENMLVDDQGEVLRWAGYEEATNTNAQNGFMAADAGTGAWWANQPAFYKSEEKSFVGTSSLKFAGDATATNQLWRMDPDKLNTIPKGTCIVRQHIYIASGSDIKVLTNILEANTSAWLSSMLINWDVSEATVPRDTWVLLETTTTNAYASDDASVTRMRWQYTVNAALNPDISASQTFYLDELEIIPIESRP